MPALVRHPDTPPGAIISVDGELERVAGGAIARFRAVGDTARLILPPAAPGNRSDGLWRTTCFELFVGFDDTVYREFNLSPSTDWAAYGFSGYRSGMRPVEARVQIQTSQDSRELSLIAQIISEFPNPCRIGLTAVIEERDRELRYWSTAFAPGKPDFHAAEVRCLLMDGVSAQ